MIITIQANATYQFTTSDSSIEQKNVKLECIIKFLEFKELNFLKDELTFYVEDDKTVPEMIDIIAELQDELSYLDYEKLRKNRIKLRDMFESEDSFYKRNEIKMTIEDYDQTLLRLEFENPKYKIKFINNN